MTPGSGGKTRRKAAESCRDGTGIVVSKLRLDRVGPQNRVSGKRAGKPARNDVLSQLETQEVPEDRQEDSASGALLNNDRTTLTGGEVSGAPGDVLRQLGRVGGVKLDIERKIPGNAWWRNKVRLTGIKGSGQHQSGRSYAPRTCFFISFPGSNQFCKRKNHC